MPVMWQFPKMTLAKHYRFFCIGSGSLMLEVQANSKSNGHKKVAITLLYTSWNFLFCPFQNDYPVAIIVGSY